MLPVVARVYSEKITMGFATIPAIAAAFPMPLISLCAARGDMLRGRCAWLLRNGRTALRGAK